MPTAPSFASYKRITEEPFLKNKKLYITVENPNTKTRRDVRWYTDAEYEKAYGKPENKALASLKTVRGFSKGPILVIRNEKTSDEEYLRRSEARYATDIGWHFTSDTIFPKDAPKHFKYLLLGWHEASIDEDTIKPANAISELLKTKARNNEYVSTS